MIKVSVLYPNSPGARFDHDYYRDRHMPMVSERMGSYLQTYTVDRGLSGMAPGEPAAFVAAGHLFCNTVEDFQAGFGPHTQEILADIPNYTDAQPVILINEVAVG